MTKKQQLYYLIEEFMKNKYDIRTFCKSYEEVFYPDIPEDELTEFELSKFEALGNAVVRFSPFQEDVEKYPGVYYTEKYVEETIKSIYTDLLSKSNTHNPQNQGTD